MKELREIVKEQKRVIRFRDAEVEALRDLLYRAGPAIKCRGLRHGIGDSHGTNEPCPVEEKFKEAGFRAG